MTTRFAAPTVGGLVLLSAIPITAGCARVVQLLGGPSLLEPDVRFATDPTPVIVHIGSSLVFALVGALQFVPALRRPGRSWHRAAGRLAGVAGAASAASALWLTLVFAPKEGTGEVLHWSRLVFGTAMLAALVWGIAAIRRGDPRAHRAWMIRAYAIGMAAGTQVFTKGLAAAWFGDADIVGDLANLAGWAINLAVAEVAIRRPRRGRSQHARLPRSGAALAGGAGR